MIYAAIVGTGNISNQHILGLLEFPEKIKIVALCDIFPEKAVAIKKKYSIDSAEIFDNHQDMLASDIKIDVVHVCTPPSSHKEISVNAMNAGCHVLVEKPMAPSLIECVEMLDAERINGVTLGVIAQNRFRNIISKLKQTLDSGLAGNLRVAHVESLWWRGHSYYDLWWRGTWKMEGGGPTLNHAVHHIDMINWFTGELPIEVSATLGNVMHDNSEVEDISFASVKYKSGEIGLITSSVVHHGEEQGIILQCEHAKIAAPWDVKAEISQKNGFPQEEKNIELIDKLNNFYEEIPDLKYEGHTGQILDYYTSLEDSKRPLITGEDGKRTVELITAIYKAGFEKRTVTLPIEKNDPYYSFDGILENATHFYSKTASVSELGSDDISVGNY